MVKGDLQISEPALNLPPIQLSKDSNEILASREITMEAAIVEDSIERLEVKSHFSRLKKRMRNRSSNIF